MINVFVLVSVDGMHLACGPPVVKHTQLRNAHRLQRIGSEPRVEEEKEDEWRTSVNHSKR